MSGLEVKIESIFICLFENVKGPQIKYQVPESMQYINDEDFHSIHNYLITKEELKEKLITVKAFNHKILGCPVHIVNQRYSRNKFMFNVCFVFEANANTTCYERVLKKLAQYFTVLEIESNYVSNISDSQKQTQCKEFYTPLKKVLEEVLERLNTTGCCAVPIDEANTIHLKLVPSFDVPAPVYDHDVPILNFVLEEYHFHQWDLATQVVLPYIDGFKHVALIAAEACKDVQLVKTLIENLLYFKLVKIIPIFQYSNVYMVTAEFQSLYTSKALQQECLEVIKIGMDIPTFDDVLQVYAYFTPGKMSTVKQVCKLLQPRAKLNIDIRRLIQFGVVKNLIRRIQKYPVRSNGLPSTATGSNGATSPSPPQILQFCDGVHSYDEICVALGLNYSELDALVEDNPAISMCWK